MRFLTSIKCCMAIALCFPAAGISQGAVTYPSKPVSVIVPFAPGGSAEQEARLYTTKLSAMMPYPFVLDFKPGNATIIGANHVAKSAPDGYTLLVVTSSFTSFPALYKNLPFDILRDFAPVALMSQRSTVLLQSPAFGLRSFSSYIAYAKLNPGKINFATSGAGSGIHLAGAWMHSATNTQVTFVPYKGTGPILADLMAGRVDVTAAYLSPAIMPLIKAGKVRVLAITSAKRSPLLPDVPTVAEQGVPGFNYPAWQGIVAPGATPATVVNRINAALVAVIKSSDIAATLIRDGAEPVGSSPSRFKQIIVNEADRWRKVVQETGIRLE